MGKTCLNCGFLVEESHTGKCPKCGKTGYAITRSIVESIDISDSISTVHEGSRTKRSYPLIILSLFLGIVGSVAGIFLVGNWGILFGIACGSVSFYVGMYAVSHHTFRKEYSGK